MNIKEQIQKRGFTVSQVATLMTNKNEEITKLLLQCDTLKAHLLGLRPLPPDALQKIENAFAIEYTGSVIYPIAYDKPRRHSFPYS